MYNYLEAVKNDVMQAIEDNYNLEEYRDNRQELEEKLNDELWTDDSVTGNASGSYTFNTYKAEKNLSHNWDLLKEAADAFGIDATISDSYEHGPEYWDVTIRCYLLGQAIAAVLDDFEADDKI